MPCGGMRPGLAALWAIGGELTKQDESEPVQVTNQVHCPECGWKITGDFSWCPKCGTRLKPFKCEYCRGIIPRNQQECPRCGAPVT